MVAGPAFLEQPAHLTEEPTGADAVAWWLYAPVREQGHAARRPMRTVLLVEDELLVRELASEDLADAGFEVTSASDGEEAFTYLAEGSRFDLLFTDIRMPGSIDGWELGARAARLIPGIKIIYATGVNEAADGLAEHERYVRKPYSLNDLRAALAELGLAG